MVLPPTLTNRPSARPFTLEAPPHCTRCPRGKAPGSAGGAPHTPRGLYRSQTCAIGPEFTGVELALQAERDRNISEKQAAAWFKLPNTVFRDVGDARVRGSPVQMGVADRGQARIARWHASSGEVAFGRRSQPTLRRRRLSDVPATRSCSSLPCRAASHCRQSAIAFGRGYCYSAGWEPCY
jgi:hypothetical protein